MLCVELDGGVLVDSGLPLEECTGYVVLAVSELDRLTYWADLAQALDPSEPGLYLIMAAMLTSYAVLGGLRAIRKQLNPQI